MDRKTMISKIEGMFVRQPAFGMELRPEGPQTGPMRIMLVCPSLAPGRTGAGDYSRRLAGTVPGAGGNESGERVRSISLETVVEDCGGTIGLLKLDCEGSEYEMLDSLAMKWVKRVAAEVHSGPGMNPERARLSLKRQGFQIQRWSGGIVHAQRSNKLF